MTGSTKLRTFTMDEVRPHNKVKDCWMVYKRKVYNVTAFLDEHPGGEDVVMEVAGAYLLNLNRQNSFCRLMITSSSNVHFFSLHRVFAPFLTLSFFVLS